MKTLLSLLLSIVLIIGINQTTFSQNDNHNIDKTEVVDNSHATQHDVEHSEGEHHSDMSPLFFVIIALLIGAATRHFFRKIPLPFTVLLLIFGIGLGLLNRFELFAGWGETISQSLNWAGHIDPHAILFIFLPILIFEAAFAMDLHTFKKTATNSIILAVPGIIVAIILSAALAILLKVYNIGLGGWEWSMALMFGSVISATDPVAVVALLKELGASKKLGTLIEGESLLNDGTAIVIFMVFFTGLTGTASDSNAFMEFGRVAFGGTLIGILIAGVVIAWVKRVFNDALVEISVIIAAAYLVFFVAEHFLHMSGVLGLVALGLAMAGVGKTRISPEVGHFLHEFWELAAFIANVLIFIIVGVVISQRVEFTAYDFVLLGIFYIGVHIIRGIMLLIFYPFMRRIGYGLNKSEAVVLWYGALRGAIGLALALVVLGIDDKFISQDPILAQKIKNQFFFIVSGIVTLTLLINATTIKFIVNKLGLTKLAPAKALMLMQANQYMRTSAENALERMKTDRFIGNANWSSVKEYLPKEVVVDENIGNEIETIAEMRKRILEKEKSSYWHQFKDGLLGPVAVRRLSDGIDELLDEGGLTSLSHRKDLELLMAMPKLLAKFQTVPLLKAITTHRFIDRLSVSYDCARGFVEAQDEAIKLVESMYRSLDKNDVEGNKNLGIIEGEINENKIEGLTFIRNLKKSYPEIYDAISTRQAIRTLLNYELNTVERLQKNGRIDSGEAHKMIHHIEERMKKLMHKPPKVKVLQASDYLSDTKIFSEIEPPIINKMAGLFQTKIFPAGTKLIKEGASSDGLYLIARGTAKIMQGENTIEIVGEGSLVGEMALVSGKARNATVEAESPLTTFFISAGQFTQLMTQSEKLTNLLWHIAGARYAENTLKADEPYCYWRPKKFTKWLDKGQIVEVKANEEIDLHSKVGIIISGKAKVSGSSTELIVPSAIHVSKVTAIEKTKIFICEKIEE